MLRRECNASTNPVEMECILGYERVELPRTERMDVFDAISIGDLIHAFFDACVDKLLPLPLSPDCSDVDVDVDVDVDEGDKLLSAKTDRQYEPTPVKSTTESFTTAPTLTSGRYFTPILSIIGRRNADVAQSPLLIPAPNERESNAESRNDVDSAKW